MANEGNHKIYNNYEKNCKLIFSSTIQVEQEIANEVIYSNLYL